MPGPGFPHDVLDPLVLRAEVVRISFDDMDRDAHGRLGMRTDTPGDPALFRVGSLVDVAIPRRDSNEVMYRRQYMGGDGTLRPLGEAMPIEVSTRLDWLRDSVLGTNPPRRTNSVDAEDAGWEVLSDSFETPEIPPKSPTVLTKLGNGLLRLAQSALGRRSRTHGRHAPSDNRPPTVTHHSRRRR